MSSFTIFGRALLEEIPNIANPSAAVVSMPDLRPLYESKFGRFDYFEIDAKLDKAYLEAQLERLQGAGSIVGVGGGQAVDAAKYFAWRTGLPLFLVPTALSVNAPWGQRSAVRENGVVTYRGWAMPEAIFVDYDVVRSAPPLLSRSGAADVLCYHTALWDWRYADRVGRVEPRWPVDETLIEASEEAYRRVVDNADEIREMTDEGIRQLTASLEYGGRAFADAGWNPRHIEGSDHFIFYALERVTGRSFLHGQAVGLGIIIASAIQGNEPDRIRRVIDALGVPYQPGDMGVSWDDVFAAFDALPSVIRDAGLWHTILSDTTFTPELKRSLREWVSTEGAEWDEFRR